MEALHISLEEVLGTLHRLLDILHSLGPSRVELPINKAILEPTKTLWQMPATIPVVSRRAQEGDFMPTKGSEYPFFPPDPSLLMVTVATACSRQQLPDPCLTKRRRREFWEGRVLFAFSTVLDFELPGADGHV